MEEKDDWSDGFSGVVLLVAFIYFFLRLKFVVVMADAGGNVLPESHQDELAHAKQGVV